MKAAPTSLSVAIRACRWADAQAEEPLASELVPGASADERRRLAALGGVAGALADGGEARWPRELRDWAANAPEPPPKLVEELRELIERGADPLAALYERAVRPRNRRRLGTFFTPPKLVDHMLDRAEALAGVPDVVVDPGAGVGAFSLAAAQRWPDARVIAVDINLVTLGLLAARLAQAELQQTELVLADFLPWLSDAPREPDSVWLYLGNPPFTRTQGLDAAVKQRAAEAAGDLVSSGHATLSTFFAAAVVRRLRPQDAMCLLLPAAWTQTRSARELRAGLWARRRRPFELLRWPNATRAFTGPDVTATVVTLGAEMTSNQPYRYARGEVRGDGVVVFDQREQPRTGSCPEPMPGGSGRRVTRAPGGCVPLGRVFRPRRGMATGANRYFFVDHVTAQELPAAVQRPGILTMRGVSLDEPRIDQNAWRELVATGHRCVLLRIPQTLEEEPAVAAYLAEGRRAGLHRRHLCAKRKPWFSLEPLDPPELLLAPLFARTVHVVRNDVGATPSNSLYGLYRQPGVGDDTAEAVEAWLRSADGNDALRGHARRLSGGSLKLEPGDLLTLPIPRHLTVTQPSARQPTPQLDLLAAVG